MFFHDPLFLVLTVVGGLLVFLPQMWVQRTYRAFATHSTAQGLTGAEVATQILRENGLHEVSVEVSHGLLSDHYDPSARAVRLSEDNYYGRSVAGAAVAAHEVGHAIQHARGFTPVVVRSAMFPAVNLGSQLGPLLFMASLFMGIGSELGFMTAALGVVLFSLSVLFHVVTLPVEIDASLRAIKILSDGRYLTTQELPGAKKVLTAAAMTYVAAALYSLMQLMYYIFTLLNSRRDD
ncbi:MAG: zinc metallopeptidase [Candidatus Melainabacteria bacterium]|nr:zinc metallopeptidase [Candidatus Melainabacteria bacterium]